jgi:hypothetical protein
MSQPARSLGGYANLADALAAVRSGLAFIAAADAPSVPAAALADCLRDLEAVASVHTAARTTVLAAFIAHSGCQDDGHGSARSWLAWQTRVTEKAAGGIVAWVRRTEAHPLVHAALAAGEISESVARELCRQSGRLPADARQDADQILLTAHAGGATLADLIGLVEEMLRRCAPPDKDDDRGFGDRGLQLDLHYRGAGKLTGDLTPECAAAVMAGLDALSKKAGPADDRTPAQRRHDALEQIFRRAIAAGDLPDTAGQPTQILLHMTLDQIRNLNGAAEAEAAWEAGRAAGDGQPGWLSSRAAAEAYSCDAQIQPIVSGHVDPAALAAMTDSYLAGIGPGGLGPAGTGAAWPLSPRTMRRLQDTLLRYAADALSGPAGLASYLRTRLPAAQFPPSASLPLDIGKVTHTIPGYLRRAVIARDRRCAVPGCRARPSRCHVHHIKPRSQGGTTSLGNLVLLCEFHHLTAIHRWGWTIALNGDGTTTFTSPDGKRVFHSHGPPATVQAADSLGVD